MNESLARLLSLLVGAALGMVFFGGLWWTVHRAVRSQSPAIWFLGSLMLRMGIVLGGFYCVGAGHWQRLLACLLGFILARLIVTWLTRLPKPFFTQASAAVLADVASVAPGEIRHAH